MKRIIFAALLSATPAIAQQPAAPGQRAWEIMSQQCLMREQNATGVAIEQSDKVESLTKQLAAVTKERDALKTAADKAKPAAKPEPTDKPAAP
jgi:hypothetical protein